MNLYKLFLLFLIYAILGWIIEVANSLIVHKKFVNRGFLMGPYCPIYGCGGVLITLFLTKYQESPIVVFVMGVFICAILEYLTSYIMEKLFKARWWDYSNKKFNINGRICLETLIPFGLLGIVVIYITNPLINYLLSLLAFNVMKAISLSLFILFVFDTLVSFKIIDDFKLESRQFKEKDNTEEISKKVREALTNRSPLGKRLVEAFPNVSAVLENVKKEIKKTQNDLRVAKKDLKKTQKKIKKMETKLKKSNKR